MNKNKDETFLDIEGVPMQKDPEKTLESTSQQEGSALKARMRLDMGRVRSTTRLCSVLTLMKKMRQDKMLRLIDISQAMQISEASLSRYERGIMLPSDDHIYKLEKFFGKKIERLLESVE